MRLGLEFEVSFFKNPGDFFVIFGLIVEIHQGELSLTAPVFEAGMIEGFCEPDEGLFLVFDSLRTEGCLEGGVGRGFLFFRGRELDEKGEGFLVGLSILVKTGESDFCGLAVRVFGIGEDGIEGGVNFFWVVELVKAEKPTVEGFVADLGLL